MGELFRLAYALHVLCEKTDQEEGDISVRVRNQIMQLSFLLDQAYATALSAGAQLDQAYLVIARSRQCYLLTLTAEGVTYQPASEVVLVQVA